MFSALCEDSEILEQKVNLFLALAPVVRVDNLSSGLIKKLSDNENLENLIVKMNIHELFPSSKNNSA